jgi:hypothetical protein
MRRVLRQLLTTLLALALVTAGTAHAHIQPCTAADGSHAVHGVEPAHQASPAVVHEHTAAHDHSQQAGHGHDHQHDMGLAPADASPAPPIHGQTHASAHCNCTNCGVCSVLAMPEAPTAVLIRTASILRLSFGHRPATDRSVTVDPGIPKTLV